MLCNCANLFWASDWKTPRLRLQKLQRVINPSVPMYHNYGLGSREVNNAVSREISLREWAHNFVLSDARPYFFSLALPHHKKRSWQHAKTVDQNNKKTNTTQNMCWSFSSLPQPFFFFSSAKVITTRSSAAEQKHISPLLLNITTCTWIMIPNTMQSFEV